MLTYEIRRPEGLEAASFISRRSAADAFAPRLQRVFELRMRAVRNVKTAASARRDVTQGAAEALITHNIFDIVSGAGSDLLLSLKGFDWSAGPAGERELQLRAILEATVENLVATNEALADMANTMAKQLVGEPGKLISGSEIAEMLGVSEEMVRLRHRDGKLIAILSAGRERGRGFPIFQAWDGVAGAPLEQIFKALGYEGPGQNVDAAQVFQFFIARNEFLGGFTPVEVLTGAGVTEPDDAEAAEFLSKPHEQRVEFVVDLAHAVAKGLVG